MKKRACLILVASLLSWVCVTSRPFTFSDFAHQQADQDQNPHPQDATFDPKQGVEGIEGLPVDDENEGKYRGLSRLGSRPPNCEHKCQGCVPCFPVQIPTTTDQIGLQYANYEPEGWKCKCGSTFFNP
ncbi:hypothetical protein ACE6H2_025157 [Prunus campanulata]